jgi:hypothetical protein
MMKTTYLVYYMKPDSFRRFNFGQEFPTVAELGETHKKVRTVVASDLEAVFAGMQAEVWSPYGEAQQRIRLLGLSHTSMSVGDVVYDSSTGKHFVAAPMGFKEIK